MNARIFFLLLVFPLGAAGITIEEAVEMALTDSEAGRMIRASGEALKSAGDQAAAFTGPQFTMGSGYIEMGDNRPEIPIPALNPPDRDFSAELMATQLLFAGGRITQSLDLRRSLWRQADLITQSGRREIVKNVRNAFNAVLYQQAALEITINRLAQRADELQDAKDLREVGMAAALDVRQAQLHVTLAEDRKIAGETALAEAILAFNLLLGRSSQQLPLIPAGRLENLPDTDPVIQALEQKLADRRLLDLELKTEQAQAAHAEWRLAKGERWPSLSAIAAAATNGEQLDEMYESWKVGINLNWPLYAGGLVQARIAKAQAELSKTTESREQTRKRLSGDIAVIKLNLTALARRIEMQRQAVSLSRENYLDARGHYRAGAITLTRLGEFSLSDAEAKFVLIGLYFAQSQVLTDARALLGE